MAECKYESTNGTCLLNECLYGDFLEYDDSQFDTGRYCFCTSVEKERIAKKQSKEQNNDNTR